MNTRAEKTKKNTSQSATHEPSQKKSVGGNSAFQFVDNRPEAIEQQKQIDAIQNASNTDSLQKKENKTGLPDNLKSGIENISGYAMDDVEVHYNSDKPVQLNAHAYAQGTNIHLAPGQEKHLPHEAWHVVQQKQGRVQPTIQMKGKVNINDDAGLEKEADEMGAKAWLSNFEASGQLNYSAHSGEKPSVQSKMDSEKPVVQRFIDPITGIENYQNPIGETGRYQYMESGDVYFVLDSGGAIYVGQQARMDLEEETEQGGFQQDDYQQDDFQQGSAEGMELQEQGGFQQGAFLQGGFQQGSAEGMELQEQDGFQQGDIGGGFEPLAWGLNTYPQNFVLFGEQPEKYGIMPEELMALPSEQDRNGVMKGFIDHKLQEGGKNMSDFCKLIAQYCPEERKSPAIIDDLAVIDTDPNLAKLRGTSVDSCFQVLGILNPKLNNDSKRFLFHSVQYCLGERHKQPGGGGLSDLAFSSDEYGNPVLGGRPSFDRGTPEYLGGEMGISTAHAQRHVIAWHNLKKMMNLLFKSVPINEVAKFCRQYIQIDQTSKIDKKLMKTTAKTLGLRADDMGESEDRIIILKCMYIMNSNPKNLWLGSSRENSAIPSIYNGIKSKIKGQGTVQDLLALARIWVEFDGEPKYSKEGARYIASQAMLGANNNLQNYISIIQAGINAVYYLEVDYKDPEEQEVGGEASRYENSTAFMMGVSLQNMLEGFIQSDSGLLFAIIDDLLQLPEDYQLEESNLE